MSSHTSERVYFDDSITSPRPINLTKRVTVAQIQLSASPSERARLTSGDESDGSASSDWSPKGPGRLHLRKQVTDLGLPKTGWRTSKALIARERKDVSADSCRASSTGSSRAFSDGQRDSFDDSLLGDRTKEFSLSNSFTWSLSSAARREESSSSTGEITAETLRSLVDTRPLLRHLNLADFIPEENLEMHSDEFDRTVLGAGGQGRIFLATLKTTGEQVAVKVSNKESVLQEYVIASKLRHEHVVRPIGFSVARLASGRPEDGSNNGEEWVNMAVYEYCRNGDLLSYLEARPKKASDPNFLRLIFSSVLAALTHIHSMGYVHCDIKPGNILVDAAGRIKLGDLGMCQQISESMNAQGTPSYLAPEVVVAWCGVPRSHAFSDRIDIFSLGVTMVYVVSRQYPFNRITARLKSRLPVSSAEFAQQFRISEQCLAKLSEIDPQYTVLASKCLQVDPQHRPSARELLAGLA